MDLARSVDWSKIMMCASSGPDEGAATAIPRSFVQNGNGAAQPQMQPEFMTVM
jgi:hypothetical protein